MDEIWKDIIPLKGMYQISNSGRVRSVDRIVPDKRCLNGRRLPGAMMKLRLDKDGYSTVNIRLDGKTKIWKVHRLVAEHFLDNTNNYSEVDHINGVRNDNRVDNLRWCTPKAKC